jgi:hypothetical protein
LMENPSAWSRRIWTEKTGEKRKIELLNLWIPSLSTLPDSGK